MIRLRSTLALVLALTCSLSLAQPPLETAEAAYRAVPRERVFDARVEAVKQATVSAQISGRITEVNFDVDDFVDKGEVIVRFRDAEPRAALDAAQARFNQAQAEFRRLQDLYKKQLVSKSAFDAAEADLKAARAELELARERLEHTVVRAPYAGIVTERHVEPGETANVGQPLMTGISLEALRVTARVPQGLVPAIRAFERARVLIGRGESARVLESDRVTVFPYADPDSHTFRVRVDLPEGAQGLYPGMFTKVAFTVGEDRALLVPARAVAYRSEVSAVYVVDEQGGVSLRQVRVGARHGDLIEVLAGLAAGERVALDPVTAAIYLKERSASRHE